MMSAGGGVAGGISQLKGNLPLDVRDLLAGEMAGKLEEAFKTVDMDGNKILTRTEVLELWVLLFPNMTMETIEPLVGQLMTDLDADGNGEISWDELTGYFRDAANDASAGLNDDDEYEGTPPNLRSWLWGVVENSFGSKWIDCPRLRKVSFAYMTSSQLAIVISIVNMMIESLPELQTPGKSEESGNTTTKAIEAMCIITFTLEFFLRFISCPSHKDLMTSGFTWVDLLSILPYYLSTWGVLPNDTGARSLVVLRILRLAKLARVLRVLKIGRYSEGIQLMVVAVSRAGTALTWLLLLNLMAVSLFSSLMFYVEKDEAKFDESLNYWVRNANSRFIDAGQRCAFQSIPASMWWALVTLTTVGYGDEVPVTELGKAVASVTMMAGLLVIAYPITILTSSFQQAFEEWKETKEFNKRKKQWLKECQLADESVKVPEKDAPDCRANSITDNPPVNRKTSRISSLRRPTRVNMNDLNGKVERQEAMIRALIDMVTDLRSEVRQGLTVNTGLPCSNVATRSPSLTSKSPNPLKIDTLQLPGIMSPPPQEEQFNISVTT